MRIKVFRANDTEDIMDSMMTGDCETPDNVWWIKDGLRYLEEYFGQHPVNSIKTVVEFTATGGEIAMLEKELGKKLTIPVPGA